MQHRKKLQAPKPKYSTIVVGFVATLALVAIVLYPYISPNFKTKSIPAPAVSTKKQPDLLSAYNWSNFAGATQSLAGLHISPLGRAIVNQDGTPNQTNPPVNLDGPHLAVTGDFSITATVSNFDNVGSLQFYSQVPIIYDEWRYETPSIKISQANHNIVVDMWNGNADTTALHKVFTFKADVTQLTVARVGQNIEIAANGNQALGSLPNNNVFSSGMVWFGADAALNSSGWTLTSLKAQPLSGGTVQVIGSPDLVVAHNNPTALRNLALKQSHVINIGAAVAINPLLTDSAYRNLAIGQFDMWTPENEMKPQFIHPQPNVYSFKEADLFVNMALANGIKVHGHTLVFGEANPAWMQAAPLAQRKQIMIDHISTVVGHFKGKVAEWDVTDELLNDDDDGWRSTIWEQAMGIQDEFATAFKTAHAADPNAILCDNEYGLENSDDAWNFYFDFIKQEKAAGVPIDCVGFEEHVYDPSTDSFTAAQLEQRMQQLATIGIMSRGSELDVDGDDPTFQANQYATALQACLAVPTCIDFSTWGITDKYGSTTNYHEYPLDFGNDLMWDANLQPKPAYKAVQQLLEVGANH